MASSTTINPPPPKILLTGATGFIGGTILHTLLTSQSPTLQNATITCPLRGPSSRATLLTTTYGPRVRPVLYAGLDDTDTAASLAAQHDLVINATHGFHLPSAAALLRGLAARKAAQTGRAPWLLQMSGASNLADRRISGAHVETGGEGDGAREFDDAVDDVYAYEKGREEVASYEQRRTKLGVVDLGVELGVKTVVVMPPLVFGVGTGLFHKVSVQIPTYIEAALGHGRAVVVGKGEGRCDHVHVEDLAALYEILVLEVLERDGSALPTGRKGVVFAANGRHSWMDVAQGVADACYEAGVIADKRVESVGLAEGAKLLTSFQVELDESIVEISLSGNARTVATVARRLGWKKPTRGEDAWRKTFRDDVKAVLEKK